MKIEIAIATPQDVLTVWPLMQDKIRKALTRAAGDTWTEQQLLQHLCLGPGKMLIAKDGEEILGCLIIELLTRWKGKCLYVLASAGIDHGRWSSEMNEVLRALARDAGCYCIEAYCADGVERVIQKYGWQRKAVLMVMEMT